LVPYRKRKLKETQPVWRLGAEFDRPFFQYPYPIPRNRKYVRLAATVPDDPDDDDETGCVGPYCNGTGGCGECNCKCCPPPCCSPVTITFECGTAASEFEGGCECIAEGIISDIEEIEDIPFTQRKQITTRFTPPTKFPTFSKKKLMSKDGEFVFAMSGGCSIPCTTVTVTVGCKTPETNGCCCIEADEDGNMFAVGNGYVEATVSGGSEECGEFTVSVNGSDNEAFVNDCTGVFVTLSAADGCCPCCEISRSCGGESFHLHMMKKKLLLKKTYMSSGKSVTFINKEALLKKVKKLYFKKG
jgi:hypothetical protein